MNIRDVYIKAGAFVLDILQPKRVFIENIYDKKYPKNVLICYLVHPFYRRIKAGHTNGAECVAMAKAFNDLDFNVDVCRYDSSLLKMVLPSKKYEIIIGIEPNFEKLIEKFKPGLSIYYATGSHWKFQNTAEINRIVKFEKEKGTRLLPRRQVKPTMSSSLADAVIVVGNETTKNTYLGNCKKILMIDVTGNPVELQNRNWTEARNNFLWFGSVGAVHKGLDLLLEVFSKLKDQHLYICGSVKDETDFVDLYKKELSQKNIHFVGWVHPMSKEFLDISEKCGFSILPSCSEGMSSSVATCMRAGMIPLVTRECGISVDECLIIKISKKDIKNKIESFSKMDPKKLETESNKIGQLANKKYSVKSYQNKFRRIIENLIL